MISSFKKTGNFATVLSNGKHEMVSDVLPALGGEDQGLNPHELLEASLAGCTSITVQMYAKRKNMQLSGLNVEVKIVKEGSETIIERTVHLEGNLTSEEKMKLMEIANKCPIHKLLEGQIKVETHEK